MPDVIHAVAFRDHGVIEIYCPEDCPALVREACRDLITSLCRSGAGGVRA
jgi:hypothetical protein